MYHVHSASMVLMAIRPLIVLNKDMLYYDNCRDL